MSTENYLSIDRSINGCSILICSKQTIWPNYCILKVLYIFIQYGHGWRSEIFFVNFSNFHFFFFLAVVSKLIQINIKGAICQL